MKIDDDTLELLSQCTTDYDLLTLYRSPLGGAPFRAGDNPKRLAARATAIRNLAKGRNATARSATSGRNR